MDSCSYKKCMWVWLGDHEAVSSHWAEAKWKVCKDIADTQTLSLFNEPVKKNMFPLFRLQVKSNQSSAKT